MIEEGLLKDKNWQRDKLLAYGFQQEEDGLIFCQSIMDGQFEVRIRIKIPAQAWACVWDMAMGEAYHAVHIKGMTGSFVGEVRKHYHTILKQVVRACSQKESFQSLQGKRLVNYLAETFQEYPDYPFKKAPDIAVMRYPSNQKWYALIARIPWSALLQSDTDEEVEMINVKVAPTQIEEFLKKPGIFPAYHMSKKHWVSIVLDDTLSDAELVAFVKKSREFIVSKS